MYPRSGHDHSNFPWSGKEDSNGLAEGLSSVGCLWVTLSVVPLSSACCETKISRFFSWNIFETSDAAQLENPNMKWIMNLHGCSEACFDGYLSEVRMAAWLSKPMLNRQWLGSWFDRTRLASHRFSIFKFVARIGRHDLEIAEPTPIIRMSAGGGTWNHGTVDHSR